MKHPQVNAGLNKNKLQGTIELAKLMGTIEVESTELLRTVHCPKNLACTGSPLSALGGGTCEWTWSADRSKNISG